MNRLRQVSLWFFLAVEGVRVIEGRGHFPRRSWDDGVRSRPGASRPMQITVMSSLCSRRAA